VHLGALATEALSPCIRGWLAEEAVWQRGKQHHSGGDNQEALYVFSNVPSTETVCAAF